MAAIRMPQRQAAQGPTAAGGVMSPPYAQPAPQGTLSPGTRIMVGPIVVTVQKYLSQGGFAHIYLVTTDKPVPMPVSATSDPGATKSTSRGETLHVLKRMAVPDKESLASVRGEVEVHKLLRSHANIVHFIEASATALQGGGYEIFILMEYCSGGGIIDLMNARLRTRLSEAEVLKIFGDVAAGLSVMHNMSPPLMHRDLKVENILLAPPPRNNPGVGPTYKLCDFGSTKAIKSRKPPQTLDEVKAIEADLNKCTTLQYRAPEMVDVYQRRVIDEKADIWAMGVLLYKLCYYTTPFEENGGGPLAILNARYRFPQSPPYSQRLKDLIASMLQERSDNRPSIDQVLLRVHHMLGTRPPSSVLQKVEAAANGIHGNQQTSSKPAPRSGSNSDLLQAAPSQADQRREEAEEAKKRSEAITPMRRGRPNRDSGLASAAAKFEPATGANAGPSLRIPVSPIKSPLSAKSSDEPLGFADSFSPSTHTKAHDITAKVEEPSRPSSVLDHSPSLPGFDSSSRIGSARASPLPPPLKALSPPLNVRSTTKSDPIATQKPLTSQLDNEARDRFPSVEELDRKYPIADVKAQVPSVNARQKIPGLADRPSVSAMTDKFGSMAVKRASAPVPPKAAGTVGPAKKASSNLVGQRWPHSSGRTGAADKAMDAVKSTANDAVTSPPSLPSRKHDWLKSDTNEAMVQKESQEVTKAATDQPSEAMSSGDEDEGPEDLDAPAKMISGSSDAGPAVQTSSIKEKPVRIPNILEADSSTSPSFDTLTPERNSKLAKNEAIEQEQVTDQSGGQSYASPPAWDEDDEEMHFLPQPTISDTNSGPASATSAMYTSTFAPIKAYTDASTSPIGRSPSPSVAEQQKHVLQDLPAMQQRPQPPILSPKPSHLAKASNEAILADSTDSTVSSNGGKPAPPVKPTGIRARQNTFESKSNATLPVASRSPPFIAPKPSIMARGSSIDETLARNAKEMQGKPLKPWEREAMEKERVQKYGSLRSRSPEKADTGTIEDVASAKSKVKGEAQERFQGVSSLISQWQNNAARGAPGWGTVGASSSTEGTSNAHDSVSRSKASSKDEDAIFRPTPYNVQGRLPSREV